MNNLQIFNYEKNQVRITVIDNQPWWVAKDVCDILEVGNPSQALSRLEEDEKSTLILNDGTPGNPNTSIVNEPGLYSLILGSRKPEAKAFKRWVTHEVIPSIRKHGAYMTPEKIKEVLQDPDTIIQLAQQLKAEMKTRLALETKIEQDKPKIIFADAVTASHTSILIGDLAKLLRQNGYNIGQNRLFEYLRKKGYLIKSGASRNIPTQKAMEMGLFEIKETTINNPDGSIRITKTPKITGKGQVYFINHFLKPRKQGELAK
jgi:anti-repressor protein